MLSLKVSMCHHMERPPMLTLYGSNCSSEDFRETEIKDWRGYSNQPAVGSRGESNGVSVSEQSETKIRGGIGKGGGEEGAWVAGDESMCTFRLSHDGDGGINEFLADTVKSARNGEGEGKSWTGSTS